MLTLLLWASLALLLYALMIGEFPETDSVKAVLTRYGLATVSAVAFFFGAFFLFGTPIAGVVWVVFGWMLPTWVAQSVSEKRHARLKGLARDFVTSAAGLYAVGQMTPDVVRVMAQRFPEPIGEEFRRMIGVYNMNSSASFPRMFEEMARKYGLLEFSAVANILAAGEQAGGPVAVSKGLKRLGQALRQRDHLATERQKAIMEPKIAAIVVIIILLSGLLVDATVFRDLFAGTGSLVLVGGSALVVGIIFLFQRINRSNDLA